MSLKRIVALALLSLPFEVEAGSFLRVGLPSHRLSPKLIDTKPTGDSPTALRSLRGGSVTVPVKTLATIWAGLDVLSGSMLSIAPESGAGMFDVVVEKGTFSAYLIENIGVSTLVQGIQIYLATVMEGKIQMERAIGFGMLVKLAYLLKSLLTSTEYTRKTLLPIRMAALSWSTISLLTGKGKPLLAARVVSITELMRAWLLFFKPMTAAFVFFGEDVTPDEMIKPRTICRSLGFNLFINAVFVGALAFGLDSVTATAISALTWSCLLFEMLFVSKTYLALDKGPGQPLVFFCLSVLMTAGFLLASQSN